MNESIASQPTLDHEPLPVYVAAADTFATVPIDTTAPPAKTNSSSEFLGAGAVLAAMALVYIVTGRKHGHATPEKDAQQEVALAYAGRNDFEQRSKRKEARKAARSQAHSE